MSLKGGVETGFECEGSCCWDAPRSLGCQRLIEDPLTEGRITDGATIFPVCQHFSCIQVDLLAKTVRGYLSILASLQYVMFVEHCRVSHCSIWLVTLYTCMNDPASQMLHNDAPDTSKFLRNG